MIGLALAVMAACGPGAPLPSVSPPATPIGSGAPVVLPLPGLASAPPGTQEQPEVVIRSRALSQELDGWWHLEGRVLNVGQVPARSVGLTARLYDSHGVLLDTREALLTPDYLSPAQEGHYRVTWPASVWPASVAAASVTLEPRWVFLPD